MIRLTPRGRARRGVCPRGRSPCNASCEGDWFVWAGLAGTQRNRSASGPNMARSWAEFGDGPSHTLLISEGKGFGTYYRDCSSFTVNDPDNVPMPEADPPVACPEYRGVGRPSFAAVTARSYHPGGVQALQGDGSARFVRNSISGRIWRSLGAVAGGEIVPADAY